MKNEISSRSHAAWQSRQTEMEIWYRNLIGDPGNAGVQLTGDYQPYSKYLAGLRGNIIDIGGGVGIVRDYLSPKTNYIVIDPSLCWREESWCALRNVFPSVEERRSFVQGMGEMLPFESNHFDSALSLWSLNHAINPEQCVIEMYRVLKPRGKSLVVLEDMEPHWGDVARRFWQRIGSRFGREVSAPLRWHQDEVGTLVKTIVYKLSGSSWPLQRDHSRIVEREWLRWIHGRFDIVDRSWNGGYLSFYLERRP
jgi:ubiquinone/menaquinone biosynthesis C-methylase UbiE